MKSMAKKITVLCGITFKGIFLLIDLPRLIVAIAFFTLIEGDLAYFL